MEKHRKHNRLVVLGAAVAAFVAAFAAPASAETQDVTTTVVSSVAMTTAPTAAVNLGSLKPGQTGTASGGALGVSANVAYTVTLKSSHAQMTNAAGTKKLTADLAVAATTASGTGVGASTTSTLANGLGGVAIATGVGGTDDSYSLSLSQLASVTDVPDTYALTLTYTAAATL